jgi:hypothetical protein
MRMMIPFIRAAGTVQLLIVAANFWIPSILDYRGNLDRVTPFIRQVFVVHTLYIVLTVLGIAMLSLFFAPQLASGAPLVRAINAFLAVFWLLRVFLQFGYYDRGVRAMYRCGDVAYTLAISSLAVVFASLALGVQS